jgi:glycine hydroxymethyltransferase
LGSPAVTTRGFKEAEMGEVANLIVEVLNHIGSDEAVNSVRSRVETLTGRFPLYGWKL